ncbi:1754_t:CDS:2 [Diversispora eburnea]|uniref:1754_t:CDS:1 n=1 Tax=Diversispora eburnea TaxID=1213867 RepID=A0A9N9G135_9GLOM|nr:1754_t:CDS:2 [Diversispora eburnea]
MVQIDVQMVCKDCKANVSGRFASNSGHDGGIFIRGSCAHWEYFRVRSWTTTGWLFGGNAKIRGNFEARCKSCGISREDSFGFWGWPQHDRRKGNMYCSNCRASLIHEALEPFHYGNTIVEILTDITSLVKF